MTTTTADGTGYKIIDPEPGTGTYPATNTYQWQEFAGAAVEFGGYGDATLTDPWSGRRLWVAGAARETVPDTLRRLADVADEVGFYPAS